MNDPLLSQARERHKEDRVILRCMTGHTFSDRDLEAIRLPPLPLVPLGRHGTECRTWLEMPMGDIESPVRLASRYVSLSYIAVFPKQHTYIVIYNGTSL